MNNSSVLVFVDLDVKKIAFSIIFWGSKQKKKMLVNFSPRCWKRLVSSFFTIFDESRCQYKLLYLFFKLHRFSCFVLKTHPVPFEFIQSLSLVYFFLRVPYCLYVLIGVSGHFTPKTFHPRTFHPGTFHPKDISPRRHFTPRTFHPTDISPHVRFTPLFEKRIQWAKRNEKKEQLLRNWCVNNRTNSIKGLDLKAALHFLNAY